MSDRKEITKFLGNLLENQYFFWNRKVLGERGKC